MTTVPPPRATRKTGPASVPPTPRARPRKPRPKPVPVPAQRTATNPPLPGSWPLALDLRPAIAPLSLNVGLNLDKFRYATFARSWRTTARLAAQEAGWKNLDLDGERLHVMLVLRFSTNHKRDVQAGNWVLPMKHALDGLVDAGLVPNDTDEWIATSAQRQDIVVRPKASPKVAPLTHRIIIAPESHCASAYDLWVPASAA